MIVSDTTPLSELAKANRLGLLHQVYERITIPRAVLEEVTSGDHPAAQQVPAARWIDVRDLASAHGPAALSTATKLGLGECAAILLAEELQADLVLIDEQAARTLAMSRGLEISGTVGTVLLAKRLGCINRVRPVLDELFAHGTWISAGLYRRALALAGEDA